jgi:hypothetical protein
VPLALLPVGRASGQARAYIRDILTGLGRDALLDSAQLGVTELVTNACLHARTPIVVALRVTADGVVRIEVSDDSPRLPERRAYDATATTGRGLGLLSLFGRWGIDPVQPARIGKTVWFEPTADVSATSSWDAPTPGQWAEGPGGWAGLL